MSDLNEYVDLLIPKIKHLIITTSGHTVSACSIEEFYYAFCLAFREQIMVNMTATIKTMEEKKPRTVNFISMEYLPGRFIGNNISNLKANDLVRAVLKTLDRNFEDVLNCETDPGLGNGGLGRLSSCFLDSLATQGYPARAYGLRYQYGIFEQEIWNGVQIEKPDCWLLNIDPWESRHDIFSANIHFRGQPIHATNKHGDDVYHLENFEEVRALPFDVPIVGYAANPNYSVLILRLWSTKESPRNFALQRYNAGFLDQASENTSLTDILYPNDNNELGKRVRLKQEFLLVSASVQDIIRRHLRVYGDLSSFRDKVRIQINDTHPTLIIAELPRILMKNFNYSWKDAWETTQEVCSYTNHTILREALEEWNEHRIAELLPRQHLMIQRLNQHFCDEVRKSFPGDEERVRRLSIIEGGQIRMAHLSAYGCHTVNGVAELHTKILKETIFKDFHDLYPDKFVNVTNGVTQRRWLFHANPLLQEFVTKKIGNQWITDFSTLSKLHAFASDKSSQEEFLLIKKKNKENLIHLLTHDNPLRDSHGKILEHSHTLEPSSLFDVHIKRFHEYKRQLMNVLHLIMIHQEAQPRKVHRLAIFGGKAAPGYERAKEIIQLINAVARSFHSDETARSRLCIAFVENYNVTRAETIIPAADLSQQISTAGWEASGTGNMKLAINGALTIGTNDGANIEMRKAVGDPWWPFAFGSSADENQEAYVPREIYHRDPQIRAVLDTLKDGIFAATPEEKNVFAKIFHGLIEQDPFRVLKDLRAYYEMQKKVESLFLQPNLWAETALHNIASMGPFSTDVSIHNYAAKIWGVEPCPVDLDILAKVKEEYQDHSHCNRPIT